MNKNIVVSNIKGGFGNQLFQYATGFAIAIKNNAEYKLDLSFFEQEQYKPFFRLDSLNLVYKTTDHEELASLKNEIYQPTILHRILIKLNVRNKYKKATHIIDSSYFKPSKKIVNAKAPTYIEGWCVKLVYFNFIKSKLIDIFSPKYPFSEEASETLNKIKSSNSISIHIRRGDYINNKTFEIIPLDYYLKAIEFIYQNTCNPIYFVFSDDIEWARKNLNKINNINFIDLVSNPSYINKPDVEDFFLMKECKHNIIANSSFSWWPAYLNENNNKIVIAPLKWYKDLKYQKSIEKHSFLPENWIKI